LELTLHRLLLKGRSGIELYSRLERDTDKFIPEKTKMLLRDVQNYYTERRYTKDEVDLLTLYPEKRKEFEEITKFLEGKPTAPRPSQQITFPDSLLSELEREQIYPLQWNKNKIALCACFVDCYFIKTSPNDLWKAGENPFNVKNLRQSEYGYSGNKNTAGKPRGYEIIDRILKEQ
jgi:hypothetical protein